MKRILALGNLMPRIRDMVRKGEIECVTARHLTMASKSQQRAWLALVDDENAYLPTGHHLKAWLFGGQSIPVKHALFDTEGIGGIIADLFGEDRYFADSDAFWVKQNQAIEQRRAAYLEAGWSDVVVVSPAEHFTAWEFERAPKRKGGRVYIDLRGNGEVIFHEGYVTTREARRIDKGETVEPVAKPQRAEITGTMQTYIDLHRHAALRAELLKHQGLALRLMVAHAIAGSTLWTVKLEPQSVRNEAIRESVGISRGEGVFDDARREVLALLGFSPEDATVAGGICGRSADLSVILSRLIGLSNEQVTTVMTVVMGETLASGSSVIEMIGQHIGMQMSPWWKADEAFFEALRDREVLLAMVAEIAGPTIVAANAGEKAKVLKTILRNHLAGADGCAKREGWVPRWMTFPPDAYTMRGGVGTVSKAELAVKALLAGAGSEGHDDFEGGFKSNPGSDVEDSDVEDGDFEDGEAEQGEDGDGMSLAA